MAQEITTLPAKKREQSGKGPARQLRMKNLIPAVCYGPYDKPLHVAVDPDAIKKAIATKLKFNTVIKLQVEGGESRTVLFKDYERDPLDGRMLHCDFLEVRMDKDVVVNVPVVLIGKPIGVAEGGILQQVARTLAVLCKPSDIPEKIEVDVSGLAIAESLHVEDVKAPAGVKFKVSGDQTVAVVNVPEKEEEVVKPAAAAAVPGAEGAPAAGAAGAAAPAAGAAGAAAPAAGAAAPAAGKGGKK